MLPPLRGEGIQAAEEAGPLGHCPSRQKDLLRSDMTHQGQGSALDSLHEAPLVASAAQVTVLDLRTKSKLPTAGTLRSTQNHLGCVNTGPENPGPDHASLHLTFAPSEPP